MCDECIYCNKDGFCTNRYSRLYKDSVICVRGCTLFVYGEQEDENGVCPSDYDDGF